MKRLKKRGQVEAVMDAALRPKRSLWRKMVMGGLALVWRKRCRAGCTVTMNAWQTQDWWRWVDVPLGH
ncbi:putative inner membrane protein [Escherichia coli]|uniref:Putative inner membrane protein n=1 Tax=Escherichia coli TaxID=562 RepID=A0A376UA58_ECOLX|nr:putative inner membrane protein [Escherichia coli]